VISIYKKRLHFNNCNMDCVISLTALHRFFEVHLHNFQLFMSLLVLENSYIQVSQTLWRGVVY